MASEPLKPPPTYVIPVLCLTFAFAMGGYEYYSIVVNSRVEVTGLFLIPGLILLGVIGVIDPRVPGSLQPGASGYPHWASRIARACWIISVGVDAPRFVCPPKSRFG